ncbi:MAG: prepilin peptidase [Anaerolineaceae bacterium]
MEHRLILNQFVLAGIVLLLPMGIFMLEKVNPLLKSIGISLLGGVAGYLLMLGLYYFGGLFSRLVSKLRGEEIEEIALGYGDVNLTAILGLLLGWPKIGITLLFAIILAGIFSGFYLLISVILKKYQAFSAIPYAPFLLIAATVMIYYA